MTAENAPVYFIVGIVVLAIVLRLMAGPIDGERVERYLRARGCKLVDRSWEPFGPGWFGEKDSRIYQIIYEDPQGNVHRAHVKTSLFSGVYLTQDHIVAESGGPPAAEEALRAENERLRQRLRELEGEKR